MSSHPPMEKVIDKFSRHSNPWEVTIMNWEAQEAQTRKDEVLEYLRGEDMSKFYFMQHTILFV